MARTAPWRMSSDRRRYVERMRVRSGHTLAAPNSTTAASATRYVTDDAPAADTSAPVPFRRTPAQRQAAYDQAQRMAARDPEGAAFLLAQLDAEARAVAQETRAQQGTAPDPQEVGLTEGLDNGQGEPFDPMRLLADLAHVYHWSDQQMRTMPFKRLLAYHREAVLRGEREEAANKRDMERWRAEYGQGGGNGGAGYDLSPDEAEAQLAAFAPPRPVPFSA